MMVQSQESSPHPDALLYAPCHGGLYLRAEGRFTVTTFGSFLADALDLVKRYQATAVWMDLEACTYLDSTCMGSLVQLHSKTNKGLKLCRPHAEAAQALDVMGLLAYLPSEDGIPALSVAPLPFGQQQQVRAENVLSAHQMLIDINPENNRRFSGLMAILEQQSRKN